VFLHLDNGDSYHSPTQVLMTLTEVEPCAGGDSCQGVPTDDQNPCTLDACENGTVSHTPQPGLACNDSTVCNGTETCDATGTCSSDNNPPQLDDGNPCTTDACDPVTGVSHTPAPGRPAVKWYGVRSASSLPLASVKPRSKFQMARRRRHSDE
jgi:hypothetical protein